MPGHTPRALRASTVGTASTHASSFTHTRQQNGHSRKGQKRETSSAPHVPEWCHKPPTSYIYNSSPFSLKPPPSDDPFSPSIVSAANDPVVAAVRSGSPLCRLLLLVQQVVRGTRSGPLVAGEVSAVAPEVRPLDEPHRQQPAPVSPCCRVWYKKWWCKGVLSISLVLLVFIRLSATYGAERKTSCTSWPLRELGETGIGGRPRL